METRIVEYEADCPRCDERYVTEERWVVCPRCAQPLTVVEKVLRLGIAGVGEGGT